MFQQGLFPKLSADAGVSAIAGTNIFAAMGPDDTSRFPCVVASLVGGSTDPTTNGSGVFKSRLQLDCYAFDYHTADQLRRAVIACLDGWQQSLTDGTNILNAVPLNPGTDFGGESRIFRCMVEFYVLYTLP